jgi:hypothetical protein
MYMYYTYAYQISILFLMLIGSYLTRSLAPETKITDIRIITPEHYCGSPHRHGN